MGNDQGRRTANWRRLRQQFRTMNLPCWICRQPIDYNAGPEDDRSFELDHVIPRSQRPDLAEDPTNLKPACRRCNRARGNRTVVELGTTSRNW